MVKTDNCVICAEEYDVDELKSVALSAFNVTKFKICANCLDCADPVDDYVGVRKIVNSYLNMESSIKKS